MIITIGRTYGSGGREIGMRLAARLNIPCYIADVPGISDEERIESIRMFAELGTGVIVGFCADYILAGTQGLLRVFIHNDIERRASAVAKWKEISREDAIQLALQRDRERSMIYGYHTKGKWADLNRYDLTINSGEMGIDDTVELLCQFIALRVMRKRPGGCGGSKR